jgi:rhodanese-related sulfurtransferase
MRKILLTLFISSSILLAGAKHIDASIEIVKSGIKIIDIRTKGEWIQTGIVENSIPITFFDIKGKYDIPTFLAQLNKHVDKNREFAIICRTGNRTTMVSKLLDQLGYKVINLKGGVKLLGKKGYKLTPYK